jgi:hypothetical protein
LEDSNQPLIESFGLIKDSEDKLSGLLEPSLSIDKIHLSINLSLKLLWCMYILYSGHQHIDAKGNIN